jgi:ribose 5-phosphate isomerase B
MKVALGSDHAGFQVKQALLEMLANLGHEPVDKGAHNEDSCDYPDYARIVAESVSRGECDRGILICGTGIGMSMTANKVSGIRAAKVCSEYESKMSRLHNNANVLCLGARTMDLKTQIRPIVRTWLSTEFEGGRHERRIAKMMAVEAG